MSHLRPDPITRCFFAVPLSEENKQRVKCYADSLKPFFSNGKVSWTKEENFHITLWFLGNVSERILAKIIQRAERVLPSLSPFEFHMGLGGAFPSVKKPKVLWLAPDDGEENFAALRRALEGALAHLPVQKENKKFSPHLTLGRVRAIPPDFQRDAPVPFKHSFYQRVTKVILYKSALHPAGSVYIALKTFPLTKGL